MAEEEQKIAKKQQMLIDDALFDEQVQKNRNQRSTLFYSVPGRGNKQGKLNEQQVQIAKFLEEQKENEAGRTASISSPQSRNQTSGSMAFIQNPTGTDYAPENVKKPRISALEVNLTDIKEEDHQEPIGGAVFNENEDLEFDSSPRNDDGRRSSLATPELRSDQYEEKKQEP